VGRRGTWKGKGKKQRKRDTYSRHSNERESKAGNCVVTIDGDTTRRNRWGLENISLSKKKRLSGKVSTMDPQLGKIGLKRERKKVPPRDFPDSRNMLLRLRLSPAEGWQRSLAKLCMKAIGETSSQEEGREDVRNLLRN